MVLRSVLQTAPGQHVTIQLADGALTATVETSQQMAHQTSDISKTVERTK